MQYTLVNNDSDTNITVFIPGELPLVAAEDHPNFDKILAAAVAQDEDLVVELFDIAGNVASYFEPLTTRVSTSDGRLYFDGDEINDALSTQILRFLDGGEDDWVPLVNFLEKIKQNPNKHSQEQLYGWLNARDFTITYDGDFLGYKGVTSDFNSIHSGTAIVDGETVVGRIPNNVGSVIEMPRSRVTFDPYNACAAGLHVGTYDFAGRWGDGTIVSVKVNPRDVVSVPNHDERKMRVCRYYVESIAKVENTEPLSGNGVKNPDFVPNDSAWGGGSVRCYGENSTVPSVDWNWQSS